MSEDELRAIAGESEETRKLREILKARKKDLREAESALSRHASM